MEIIATLQQKYEQQALMLANRVKKRYRHLHKRFAKLDIEVFRLYDWEIPEIRAVVDWYGGHLVVGEYTRKQTTPEWLPMMAASVAQALDVSPQKVHLKARYYGKKSGKRYKRIAHHQVPAVPIHNGTYLRDLPIVQPEDFNIELGEPLV